VSAADTGTKGRKALFSFREAAVFSLEVALKR
jgi:hypothetical protein